MLMAFCVPLAMNGQETIKANRPLQFNSERGLLEMNGTSGTTNHGDRKTTYELVTASQTDWSGNYVLVGPFNITTSYAFNGEVITSSGINLGRTTAVTIDGTTLSSIGNAAVLTIAKSTSDDSHYSIRINGDKYLTSIYNG